MAIKIGHASIDEKNKTTGGRAGDQTGREVCIRTFYSRPWQYYIECTDDSLAEKAAVYMEQICNNNNVGYDQSQRLTLYNQLKTSNGDVSKIGACETDCSALVAACYIFAGLNINPSCTTRNLRSALIASGKFKAYSDPAHILKDSYARRGSIYLKEGSHVVMALENGSAISGNCPVHSSVSYIYGMDASSNQGNIDWSEVKAGGIQFVILRGTVKNNTPDTRFKEYLMKCDNSMLVTSVYKYSYALTEADAIAEANSIITLLSGRKMMIWYDLENETQAAAINKSGIAKIAGAFIKTCENAGYHAGIYCNLNWFKNYIDDSLKKKYPIWIARYGRNNGKLEEKYRPNAGESVWQYTSRGTVPGISGNVDLDIIYDLNIFKNLFKYS